MIWFIIGIGAIASPFVAYFIYIFLKNKRVEKPFILNYIGQSRLGPYYMSLQEKLDLTWHAKFKRDSNGAFLSFDYSSKNWYVNAVDNCHQALAYFERFLNTNSVEDLNNFIKITDAIIINANKRQDGCLVLEYPIKYYEDQKTPWISAMGQGQLLLILSRAYQETNDKKYLELCEMALKPFSLEIADGGVRMTDSQRGIFYEEYAFWEENKQHHTLNGMMSALMGIHDFWKVSGNDSAYQVFLTGLKTLKKNLHAYEFPFGTAYDLRHEHGERPNFSAHYHSVHVSHLRILHALSGDVFFLQKADEWDKKMVSFWDRARASFHKLIFRFQYMLKESKQYGGWIPYIEYEYKRLSRRFILKIRGA